MDSGEHTHFHRHADGILHAHGHTHSHYEHDHDHDDDREAKPIVAPQQSAEYEVFRARIDGRCLTRRFKRSR